MTTHNEQHSRALAELTGAAGLMLSEIDTCGHEVDPAYRAALFEAWELGKAALAAQPAAGFTAGDIADQGARQFAAGYAAAKAEQHAAAQEPIGYRWRHSENEPWQYSNFPCGWEHQPLYAAPLTAALACPACEGHPSGENVPCAICKGTPAAPGIDLEQFREAVNYWFAKCSLTYDAVTVERIRNEASRLLRMIDATMQAQAGDAEVSK